MEKNQTTKAPEDKLPPVVLRPHALPNGMVIMPTNPENYTKEDLKTLKITAAVNVGLMAAVIAAAPYMKSDEAKEKQQDQAKPKVEQYQAPAEKKDTVKTVDFAAAAAKFYQNKTR